MGSFNPDGPKLKKCLSVGLWDAGASITVGGKHIANWLIGQVRNEETDEAHFLNYAQEIGADQDEFMTALSEVPTMSVKQFEKIAEMLYAFSKDISDKAYTNLQLKWQMEERSQTEKSLKESETKYRDLVENSPDAIAIYVNGTVVFVNNKCLSLMGAASNEELIGKSVISFVHPDFREIVMDRMKNVLLAGEVLPLIDEKFVRLDGTSVDVEVKAMPILFNGEPAVQLIVRDITERKMVERELVNAKEKAEESDRLKSAFLANMSHEIRTPMNGILGFADLLKEPGLSGESQKEYIHIIEKSGVRMLNIINDIIDISKIESGQMDVVYTETNVNDQNKYIYTFFKPEVEQKGLQLILNNGLPYKNAVIKTDREKIYAILTNLVKNAIKFTHQGAIEFGYCQKSSELEFYVRDTGRGIPEAQIDLIFERFRQGSESQSKEYEGSGLGLSISKAYIELLGGTIWVESKVGEGSTFYFTLPYDGETEGNLETSDGSVNDLVRHMKTLKVLIVEDDKLSAMLLTRVVSSVAKEILHAVNGVEAIEMCRTNKDIDLVLMDMKMGEMDGYQATQQIRTFNKQVVIIAQTAFTLTGDKEKALEMGCNDYISKPINKNLLLEMIREHLP